MTTTTSPWRTAPARARLLACCALPLVLGACGGSSGVPESSPTALSSDDAVAATDEPTTEEAAPTSAETAPEEQATDEASEDEGDGEDEGAEDLPDTWATFTAEPPPLVVEEGELDDDPRVRAVGRFNEAFARAATADDPRDEGWLATLDEDGHDGLVEVFVEEFGRAYPGPLPFTPLQVTELEDGTWSVQGCMVTDGFSADPSRSDDGMTGLEVSSIEYSLVDDPGAEGDYLVEALYSGTINCSTTEVETRSW
ncbi:hypothetical protein [uncultured Serinicoccus sp.]|uniref:hypothetical protein n=1 Tax=uncultured Serinicoccus sp. TaxID=735514 RepID=UPI0026130E4F|nr:hypothetical protein [uncultured Serinicoccus sp.]